VLDMLDVLFKMSLYLSHTARIGNCETQIAWNGVEAITSNGEHDELYEFRDALKAIGSTEKLGVIEKVIKLYESVHGRKADQDEAFDIGDSHGEELNKLDSEYYKLNEDLDELCLALAQKSIEELENIKKDAFDSELAQNTLDKLN